MDLPGHPATGLKIAEQLKGGQQRVDFLRVEPQSGQL